MSAAAVLISVFLLGALVALCFGAGVSGVDSSSPKESVPEVKLESIRIDPVKPPESTPPELDLRKEK